uniref:VCBS domain-containing protein n=1 Tax=Vibrio artabrorum TaxID=446374 RepID=UPI0038B48C25
MALAAVADAAVIGGADSGNIKEDVHVDSKYDISLSGHLTIQDPDGPTEALFQTISLATTPQGGTLQLYSNGNWFYDINNYAIDHLDEGQIVQDTMTVYSKDGTAHVLHFTIEGTNDIPDINAQTRYLAEDGKVLNGKMYAYDPDDHAQLTFTLGHPVDGLTMHKDGSYSFDPSNSAYQHISQNVQRTIQVPVTVTDEHGAHTTQNLSFVITGSNDGAVITGNDRGDVSEDLNVQHHELQTQGALTSHDIDNVDNAFKDESLSTLKDGSHALGTLHMDTSGTWTYTVDNRTIQSMNSNDTKVETFVVHSVDGTNHEVAVTIHGTNDAPTTPLVHTSHPAPPPPPPVPHDEPDMTSHVDFTVVQSDDSYLDLTQQPHQEPDQKTSHHGAAAYLDVLGIKPDLTSTTVHDQPADMDIVFAQVDQQDAATHDQVHLDMSDALEHHDVNINHNQDDGHHHHNDVDGLPDIDPNS